MKKILEQLFEHQKLDYDLSRKILIAIGNGEFNQSQIAAFLTSFRMRGITVEELSGFRDALLELALPIDLSEFDAIDLCGTGGDGKDTFNISTLASFVTAGAGVKVAKHGNYGVSSGCGSSNVMESMGLVFTNKSDTLKRQIDQAGICFLHAPLFHPAMKHVAPIRKELGIKTFFNMLGPLVNPSQPTKQIVGVFSLELARIYNYLFQKTNKEYRILHSLDGYDEISLTGKVKIISNNGEITPDAETLGFSSLDPSEIKGGETVESSAKIFMKILRNEGSIAQENVVLANAGQAISCSKGITYQEGVQLASESLKSGSALKSLETILTLS